MGSLKVDGSHRLLDCRCREHHHIKLCSNSTLYKYSRFLNGVFRVWGSYGVRIGLLHFYYKWAIDACKPVKGNGPVQYLRACLVGVQELEQLITSRSSARTSLRVHIVTMSQEQKECPPMPRKIEKLEESVVNRIAAGEVSFIIYTVLYYICAAILPIMS